MQSLIPKLNKNSRFYAYVLFFSVVFFLTGLLFGQLAGNVRLVMGAFIFMFLAGLAFFDMKKVLWTILFFLPVVVGLNNYQINIGTLFQNIVNIGDLYVNPFSLTCLFLIFLAIIEILRVGKKMAKIPLFFILLISAALSITVLLPSKYLAIGLIFEVYLLAGFSAYFLGYLFLSSKENFFKTILVIIFSAVIPALTGIFQLLTGNYFFENDSSLGRIAATFPHPNTFGSFLFIVLTLFLVTFFAVSLENRRTNLSKLGIYFFAFILGLLFILTYSRTAWSGLLISALAIFIMKPHVRTLMVYCGLLLSSIVLLFDKTRERILGIFEHHMYDSMYGRYEIWDMALFKAWKKPFIGYGIGSFSEIIKDTQGKETGNVYPHNDLVRFFLEGGVLGVLLYLIYLIGALYYASKSFLRYPKFNEKLHFWGKDFNVELKTLGVVPLVLFGSMIIISMVESPSMDFTYQIISWLLLGSWLGASQEYWRKKT